MKITMVAGHTSGRPVKHVEVRLTLDEARQLGRRNPAFSHRLANQLAREISAYDHSIVHHG